jgi:hypothetical protein
VHSVLLLRLEEQDCAVAEVEVDEVLGLCRRVRAWCALQSLGQQTVGDKAAKVAAYNAMPCGAFTVVELSVSVFGLSHRASVVGSYLLLDELGDVLLDAELLHGLLGCAVSVFRQPPPMRRLRAVRTDFDRLLLHLFALWHKPSVALPRISAALRVVYHVSRLDLGYTRDVSQLDTSTHRTHPLAC